MIYVRHELTWPPIRADARCEGEALSGTALTGRRNSFAGLSERRRVVFGTIIPTYNLFERIILHRYAVDG